MREGREGRRSVTRKLYEPHFPILFACLPLSHQSNFFVRAHSPSFFFARFPLFSHFFCVDLPPQTPLAQLLHNKGMFPYRNRSQSKILTNLGTRLPFVRINHTTIFALSWYINKLFSFDIVTAQGTTWIPLSCPDHTLDTAAAKHMSTVCNDVKTEGVQADCTFFVYS